jgi:hypothetical protein
MRSRHSLPQVSNKGIDLATFSAPGCKRLKSGQIGEKKPAFGRFRATSGRSENQLDFL